MGLKKITFIVSLETSHTVNLCSESDFRYTTSPILNSFIICGIKNSSVKVVTSNEITNKSDLQNSKHYAII